MVKLKLLKRGENPYEREYSLRNKDGVEVKTPLISVSSKLADSIEEETLYENYITEVLYEIRGKNTYEKLKKLCDTPDFGKHINSKLKPSYSKINTFIVAWTGTRDYLPEFFKRMSMRMLDSLNYEKIVNDNLIVPPFSYLLKRMEDFNKGWKFMKENIFPLLKSMESIVPKPENVLGYVPIYFFEGDWLRNLLKYYWELGIDKFLIDFGGLHIETLKDRVFVLIEFKRILEQEYGENTCVLYYAFNTFRGQFRKNREEIPARDFLSLFVGFDVLGTFSRRGIPSDVTVDSTPKEFVRSRYTYRKTSLPEEKAKVKNVKEKILETKTLRRKLEEENTLSKLLEGKPEEVVRIVHKITKQRKLPDLL